MKQTLFFAVAAALGLASCAVTSDPPEIGKHNLEIEPNPGEGNATDYCQLFDSEGSTWLRVEFSNFGAIAYPGGDQVRVVSGGQTSPIFVLPVIQPTASFETSFPAPAACLSGDCSFRIVWANKSVNGRCIG